MKPVSVEIGGIGTTVDLSVDTTTNLDQIGNTSIADFGIWAGNCDCTSGWIDSLSGICTSETLEKSSYIRRITFVIQNA